MPNTKKSSGKTTTAPKAKVAAGETRHAGKALAGRAGAGVEMDLSQPLPAAAAPGLEEVRQPRPYTTRFPIDFAAFNALKEKARSKGKLAKTGSTLVQDQGQKVELAAAPQMAAMAAVPEEPAAAPLSLGNFAGIAATGWVPPDCTLAAGPQHLLASVNSSLAVLNKTGGAVLMQRTLTVWFANVIQGATIFDPKLLYDQHAGRWVLLAVAVSSNPNRSWFLLSVSATSNPLGVWRNYQFDATKDGSAATNNWADFPSLGVDSQALYVTGNMFRFNGNFQYAKVRVIPKAGPYSGGAAPYRDFVKLKNEDGSMAFTVQPCHTFGAPQVEYLVNSYFPSTAAPNQNKLSLWSLTNPLGVPTLTRRSVTTSAYSLPPDAIQQGGNPLDTGDVRILHAVFRGGSLWTALTTQHNWGGAANQAAVHWFQINATSGALVQQGIYGSSSSYYFYPAVMSDTNGNAVLVFCRSGLNEFASIYFTGRKAADPLGTLQASALLKAGVANYLKLDGSGRNRWGDYNGIAGDPTDGRVVWVHSLYAMPNNAWATWIGASRF
jgi:hypothetical protein